MRTQVAIVGAGPAGLLLAHLLHRRGIGSVVLERRSRSHIEERVRAGVLEHPTVELLVASGAGERLQREGLVHEGLELRFAGGGRRIPLAMLTGGRSITVYGQQEVVKDLVGLRLAAGGDIRFEVSEVRLQQLEGPRPRVEFRHGGDDAAIECDFIAGCDGFHGVCRDSIPSTALAVYRHDYPFAWLGILAEATPVSPELVYCHHPRGFALFAMRSSRLSRLYLQCAPDEDLAQWPDRRIWDELRERLADGGRVLHEGPLLQKGVTAMRSFVAEPMQYGRLFLAGDAAHIVPATGAKGLNLAVADVRMLARALADFYGSGSEERLRRYSETCLRRVWRVQRFSWWMTRLLHRFPGEDAWHERLQHAELDHLARSQAAAAALAENYVGLPFDE